MRRFYIDVVGLELHSELSMESELPDPDGEPTISFLKICDSNTPLGNGVHPPLVVLIDFRRHVFAKGKFEEVTNATSTLNHLAFEIPFESFEFYRDRLSGNGIDVSYSEFPAMQAKAMFFRDPEGNRVEFICHHG